MGPHVIQICPSSPFFPAPILLASVLALVIASTHVRWPAFTRCSGRRPTRMRPPPNARGRSRRCSAAPLVRGCRCSVRRPSRARRRCCCLGRCPPRQSSPSHAAPVHSPNRAERRHETPCDWNGSVCSIFLNQPDSNLEGIFPYGSGSILMSTNQTR